MAASTHATPVSMPPSLDGRVPEPLAVQAAQLRRQIIEALHACGGGHYGGSLSVLDILLTLYRRQLRVTPSAPRNPQRDRLLLSKGHAALALYAVLRHLGYFEYTLASYGDARSPLEGHPDMEALPGVDFSTGSLGQGLSVGIGMALSLRGQGPAVWVVLGDGECQEGQVWEAAMLASRLGVPVRAIVDANGYQEWGHREVDAAGREKIPTPVPNLVEKWRSFGWTAIEVDGHDHEALAAAYRDVDAMPGPTVIVARTTKGKGYAMIESDPIRFHCATLSADEHAALLGAP